MQGSSAWFAENTHLVIRTQYGESKDLETTLASIIYAVLGI